MRLLATGRNGHFWPGEIYEHLSDRGSHHPGSTSGHRVMYRGCRREGGEEKQRRPGVEMDDNQELDNFCQSWAAWHRSRRLFAPPVPQNILARMRPQPVREAPDAIMSADLSYFNLALLGQPEGQGKMAFYCHYLHQVRPIKLVAAEMGMTRTGFYKAMWAFRKDAYASYRRMMNGVLTAE